MPHDGHDNLDPRLRPAEPDHPMSLEGGVVEGDTALMARCLVEELLFGGTPVDEIRALSFSPQYQSLYAARVALGHEAMEALLESTAGRVGVLEPEVWESRAEHREVTLTISAPHSANGEGA